MISLNQIYKCTVCGNIVEVVHSSKIGYMDCCDKSMVRIKENSVDASLEKHVPVIKYDGKVAKVMIGSQPHPMIRVHYIEWIEIIADNCVYKQFLKPGDKPQAEFKIKAKKLTARAYCNVHGLWKK